MPGVNILVVDDVPQNVRLLEAVLTANGYSVTTASSGPAALEQVAAGEGGEAGIDDARKGAVDQVEQRCEFLQ